jgi:hypothetical protein
VFASGHRTGPEIIALGSMSKPRLSLCAGAPCALEALDEQQAPKGRGAAEWRGDGVCRYSA